MDEILNVSVLWKSKKIHEDRYRKDKLDKLLISKNKVIILDWINTPKWRGALILDRKNKLYITSGISIFKLTLENINHIEVIKFINKKKFFTLWNKHQNIPIME